MLYIVFSYHIKTTSKLSLRQISSPMMEVTVKISGSIYF